MASHSPAAPTFSYYNNRPPEIAAPRRNTPRGGKAPALSRPGKSTRSFLAQLPLWLLSIVLAVFVLKLLFLTPTPKVIVLGNSPLAASYLHPPQVYTAAAAKELSASLTNRSKLTVNINGTVQALQHEFPELQTVSVTLPLVGNRPIVYVLAAQPSLIVQTPYGNYALNKSGLVLARLGGVPSGIPLVIDQSGVAPQSGRQFLPGSTVNFIQVVAYQFAAANRPISAFVLPALNPYEIDVTPAGKTFVIRFNAQEDARQQSGAALATLQQLGAAVPGAYLDVRVPERVYYK